MVNPEGTKAMVRTKQQLANPEETKATDVNRDMEMTPEGAEEKEDIGVTGRIEGGVAAGIADVEETMDPQEPRTLIMEEGETAGKGEAPEKSARRPQASGNLL